MILYIIGIMITAGICYGIYEKDMGWRGIIAYVFCSIFWPLILGVAVARYIEKLKPNMTQEE